MVGYCRYTYPTDRDRCMHILMYGVVEAHGGEGWEEKKDEGIRYKVVFTKATPRKVVPLDNSELEGK